MSVAKTSFKTAVAGKVGTPTGIEVPPACIAALGSSKKPAVKISIAGYTYLSTVAVMGGKFMIPLSAAHREASGLKAGDKVEVTLELDVEPRTVEVPGDLAAALSTKAGALATFEALAFSKRKEFVRQVNEAKTQETRERRIAKIVTQLSEA
jgi:hypothetical protein